MSFNYIRMKSLKIGALLAFGILFTVGCSKDEDTSGPSIQINFPKENAVYNYGDNLYLNVTFSDESGIAVYKYTLEPVHTTGTKFEHTKTITVTDYLTTYTTNNTIELPNQYADEVYFDNDTYRLKIIAEDFNNNISSKEIIVTIENEVD